MRLSSRIRSLTIGIAVLLAATFARAQAPTATCADWAAQSWSGTIMISGSGQSTAPDGTKFIASESATFNVTTTIGFSKCLSFPTAFGWGDALQGTASAVTVHDKMIQRSVDSKGNPCTITTSWDLSNNGTVSDPNAGITIAANFASQTSGVYQLFSGFNVEGVTKTVDASSCGASVQSSTLPESLGPFSLTLFPHLPLPSVIGPLSGSNSVQAPSNILTTEGGAANADASWTVSWNLAPTPPDLDVIVTIPGYDTWRPTAGKNETEITANLLTIQAQLVQKSTEQTAIGIVPEKWSFNLPNVSNEPGVAMNWPSVKDRIDPSNSPPDMTFNKQINSAINPFVTISNNDTMAVVKNPAQTPNPQQVQVILVPFDWGGWATLNVAATVFGTPIKGHLQLPNGQNVTDILLPLRQPGSHIADAWKNDPAINVPLSTPDDDDSETDPDGLPGCVGDGLTLYEEYRGFMENGKHIEGDPHKKDFFIQNLMGGDGEPGIARFTALTHLNVHKDIQKNEMAGLDASGQLGDRIINFNHKDGAHQNFDQHGVVLAACFPAGHTFTDGGVTFLTQAGVRGRPGLTTGICMQSRDLPGRFLSPDNLHRSSFMPAGTGVITASDALLQYDVGVAHELSHSVGVEHHGDVDDNAARIFQLLLPNNPQNTTGQPVFQVNGQNVRLLPELGGPDAATTLFASIQASFARCQAILANPSQNDPLVVESCQLLNQGIPYGVYVGLPHGKFSGDDRCVMRYFYAGAYPSASDSTAYYLVPAGTEPVGNALCNSPVGNPGGVNDPNRTIPVGHPQPRYFDAAATRGDCQHQVCVNDKYPPVPK